MGKTDPQTVWLCYLETDNWTFAVKIHPAREIVVRGNPTWEQILASFQSSF